VRTSTWLKTEYAKHTLQAELSGMLLMEFAERSKETYILFTTASGETILSTIHK
jgi:hypothetical protein